jgi:uncharacterized protein (TIGR00730 family)
MGLRRVCVFCGSSTGRDPAHAGAVERLAVEIVSRGAEVVYGGGGVGLMGVLADAALRAGGHVIGVIPEALVARELAHRGLPDLRIVASMHERKATMAELSDAFVAAPGGFGTFEELRSRDVDATRAPPQAMRAVERGRLFRSVAPTV